MWSEDEVGMRFEPHRGELCGKVGRVAQRDALVSCLVKPFEPNKHATSSSVLTQTVKAARPWLCTNAFDM
jgi:hypothetical protein